MIEGAQADLRALLDIPSNYKVLFMQGGALAENAIVPLNLLRGREVVDVPYRTQCYRARLRP